jgi:hypothetical protein
MMNIERYSVAKGIAVKSTAVVSLCSEKKNAHKPGSAQSILIICFCLIGMKIVIHFLKNQVPEKS